MENVHILILAIVVLLLLKDKKESFDVKEEELKMIASINDPDKVINIVNTVKENGKYMIPHENFVFSSLRMISGMNIIKTQTTYFSQKHKIRSFKHDERAEHTRTSTACRKIFRMEYYKRDFLVSPSRVANGQTCAKS